VLAANPATLPLTARFKKFFAQRTLAESTRRAIYGLPNQLKFFDIQEGIKIFYPKKF
jgi:hypothetical protein